MLRGDPTGKVAIVKIDNSSLDDLEKTDFRVLNLSKTAFSKLLDALYSDGARSVGIDVIFANRSADEKVLADALKKYPQTVIGAKVGSRADSERMLPLDAFSGARWGATDALSDRDVVSKVPVFLKAGDRTVESFAIATYRAYLGDPSPAGKTDGGDYVVNPLTRVPVDSRNVALIPFFRLPERFPTYSLKDVLDGKVPKGTFKDEAVLVGEYGTVIQDTHFSPVDF